MRDHCGECFLPIDDGDGEDYRPEDCAGWATRHTDDCPDNPHNPDGAPTWWAADIPRGTVRDGAIIRTEWIAEDCPVPIEEIPEGELGRTLISGRHLATGVVKVVGIDEVYYESDGRSFGGDDDECWVATLVVRAATPAEVVRWRRSPRSVGVSAG